MLFDLRSLRSPLSIAASSPPGIWQHHSVPSLAAEFREKPLELLEERFRTFRFANRTFFAKFQVSIPNVREFRIFAELAEHSVMGAALSATHFGALCEICSRSRICFCIHTLRTRFCSCSQILWPSKGNSDKDCEEKDLNS